MSNPNSPDASGAPEGPPPAGSYAQDEGYAQPRGYAQPAGQPAGGRPTGSNTPAIVALVTGIIALVLSWIPGINLVAFVLALIALVTGFIGIRNAGTRGLGGRGMAITGIVTGALALLIGILVYVGLANLFNDPEFQQQMEQMEQQQQEELDQG